MRDLLLDLNREHGMRGCAVVAQDGMLVAGALPADVSEDLVSALASFLLSTTNRSLKESGLGQFQNMVLNATHGKILLVGVGEVYLVVVTDQFVDLDVTMVEVMATAARLRRIMKMNV